MKNKGFSFVELLVAIAILGIVSLPIASSFALAAKIDAKARETYSAANAADDVLLLLTEMDRFENWDKEIDGVKYDAVYYLKSFLDIEGDISLPDESTDCKTYSGSYSGYDVSVTFTYLEKCYRVDVTLTYFVTGDEMQITRKGVLPVA